MVEEQQNRLNTNWSRTRKILFEQPDDFGYKLDYILQQVIRAKLEVVWLPAS